MTSWHSALMVSFVAVSGFGLASGPGHAAAAEERIVAPVEGVNKFTVTGKGTKFRIVVNTMGGAEIRQPKVTGNAKLVRSTDIVRADEDGPMIGAIEREFEFIGTAAGKAVIEIVRIEPSSPDPISEKYTVTIE